MHYENAEGYPAYRETDDKGNPMYYPMFGYPSTMLNMAIARDDPIGFEFYFTRHFAGGFEVLGFSDSLDKYCESKGAPKVAKWLRKNGNIQQTPFGRAA